MQKELVNKKFAGANNDIKKIITHLLDSDYNLENLLKSEKDSKGLMEYLSKRAKQLAKNKLEIMVDGETILGWAIHYFDETNEFLKNECNTNDDSNQTNNSFSTVENKTNNDEKISLKDIF